MGCREMSAITNCPCILADLRNCHYCSLLQGKSVCNCDWQGFCAYENFSWNAIMTPDVKANTLLSAVAFPNATGLVLKVETKYAGLPLGTIVELKPDMVKYPLKGVVLRSYPDYEIIYLLSFDSCPACQLKNQTVTTTVRHNAFWGSHILNSAENQTIGILAGEELSPLLRPLASALAARNNQTFSGSLSHDVLTVGDTADILFLAGLDNEIKKVASNLPPSFQNKVVLWFIRE